MKIDTDRLCLTPSVPMHLLALIESEERFADVSGMRAADGLRAFFVSEDVSQVWVQELRSSTDADPWVHGFAIAHRATNDVIGGVGFKGPPDEHGVVEIAYGIVWGYQNQGLGGEAAEAAIGFAFAEPGVRLIRAHTMPSTGPATRVLERCRFRRLGEIVDPEDGLVWRWERARESSASDGVAAGQVAGR